MAKREMPRKTANVADKEWSSIQTDAAHCSNANEQIFDKSVQVQESVIGIVINCKKLNLRTKPSKAASIIYELPAGSKLTINVDKSVNNWLSICTESGLEGYCMKDFVSIN